MALWQELQGRRQVLLPSLYALVAALAALSASVFALMPMTLQHHQLLQAASKSLLACAHCNSTPLHLRTCIRPNQPAKPLAASATSLDPDREARHRSLHPEVECRP